MADTTEKEKKGADRGALAEKRSREKTAVLVVVGLLLSGVAWIVIGWFREDRGSKSGPVVY